MINLRGLNYFFVLLAFVILLQIISPLSTISDASAASDQGEESSSNKGNNGKGHDNGDNGDNGDRESNDPNGYSSDDSNLADEPSPFLLNNTNSTTNSLNSTNSADGNLNNELDIFTLTSNLTTKDDFTNKTDDFTDAINITSKDSYNEKAFYILIKTENNKTSFVPGKVTLTAGDKVIWLNQDNSGHRISVGFDSKTGYQLMNVLILPNDTIDHEFQLPGTYFSVLDNLASKGDITILGKDNEDHAVSIPLED